MATLHGHHSGLGLQADGAFVLAAEQTRRRTRSSIFSARRTLLFLGGWFAQVTGNRATRPSVGVEDRPDAE